MSRNLFGIGDYASLERARSRPRSSQPWRFSRRNFLAPEHPTDKVEPESPSDEADQPLTQPG